MASRYGRKKRRAHLQQLESQRQQIDRLVVDQVNAMVEVNHLDATLRELEARLRAALGPETALTVSSNLRKVKALSGRQGRIRRSTPREVQYTPVDIIPQYVPIDDVCVVLQQYLLEVESDYMRYAKHIRFIEVTENATEVAYTIDDRTLAMLGPSSDDIWYLTSRVVTDLFTELRRSAA